MPYLLLGTAKGSSMADTKEAFRVSKKIDSKAVKNFFMVTYFTRLAVLRQPLFDIIDKVTSRSGETVNTHDSGSCALTGLEVQVLSPAQIYSGLKLIPHWV